MGSLASAPGPDVAVPDAMRTIAQGPVTLVWRNEVGGLTGRVDGPNPRYIKWNPDDSGESLAEEALRLKWLAGRHPVPEVVDYVAIDDAELLVTRALPGLSAVDEVWRRSPDAAVVAIATGLRMLHSLPIEDCPFRWDVTSRASAAGFAGDIPSIDRLVVCHGDPCAPNTLLDSGGEFLGNVDFGRLGLADRWADLAVATMSLGWNFDRVDEGLFWDTYGVEPDEERIAWYRALWNAE